MTDIPFGWVALLFPPSVGLAMWFMKTIGVLPSRSDSNLDSRLVMVIEMLQQSLKEVKDSQVLVSKIVVEMHRDAQEAQRRSEEFHRNTYEGFEKTADGMNSVIGNQNQIIGIMHSFTKNGIRTA